MKQLEVPFVQLQFELELNKIEREAISWMLSAPEDVQKRIIALLGQRNAALERAEKAERLVKQLEYGYADYLTLGGLFNPERDSAV